MKILIINFDDQTHCFVSTCIINALNAKYKKSSIYYIINDNHVKHIFAFTKNITVISQNEIKDKLNFDLVINLSCFNYEKSNKFINDFIEKNKLLKEDEEKKQLRSSIISYYDKQKNIFEIYHNLSDLIYVKEEFGIKYIPKSKLQYQSGLLIKNKLNKKQIINLLNNNNIKFNEFYTKKNIFKTMDIINKFNDVITDNLLVYFISLFLKKNVFLVDNKICYNENNVKDRKFIGNI